MNVQRPGGQPRILWVTEDPPRAAQGGSGIRQLHLFQSLASAFPTDLLTTGVVRDERVLATAAHVIQLPRRRALWTEHPVGRRILEIAIALGSRYPSPAYLVGPSRRSLSRSVRRRSRSYDVVCVEHEALSPLLPSRRAGRWLITFHLLFSGITEHQLQQDPGRRQRWFLKRDLRKARRLERRAMRMYDRVVVCSEADAMTLAHLGAEEVRNRIAVVPNGVDLTAFRCTPIPPEPRILFPGSFDFGPNVDGAAWFCTEIWPRVQAEMPHATLELVGRSPVQQVRQFHGKRGITVHANVPSMTPFFDRARAVIVPLRLGTGTRLKALEAMASGRPVVGTSIGLEGLGIVDGIQALVADDASAMAARVTQVLRDDDLAQRLSRLGRSHVEERFGWDDIGREYVAMILDLIDDDGHTQMPD